MVTKLLSLAAFISLSIAPQATYSGKTYGPPPCSLEAITQFAGGTSGSTISTATMNSNTLGNTIGTWGLNGTIAWSNAQTMGLQGNTALLCGLNQSVLSGGSPLSITEAGTGSAVANNVVYTWHDATISTVYASVWFFSNRSVSDGNTQDVFLISGLSGEFANVQFNSSGAALTLHLEEGTSSCNSQSGAGGGVGGSVTYTPSTWVNLKMRYISGGTFALAVYNTSGAQLGSTMTCPGSSQNTASLVLGHIGGQTMVSGKNNYWSSPQIWFGALPSGVSFPGLPQ